MPGYLRDIGIHNLGLDSYRYSRCNDCGTDYPHIDGVVKCNGFTITACPWCCEPENASKRASETRRSA